MIYIYGGEERVTYLPRGGDAANAIRAAEDPVAARLVALVSAVRRAIAYLAMPF